MLHPLEEECFLPPDYFVELLPMWAFTCLTASA
jgi:hypothetical protein